MASKSFSCSCLFLLPVLFLALSLPIWAQDSSGKAEEIPQNSENALSRLIEISNQLSILNERLRGELQDSRQSSRDLQSRLEASRRELEELRQELAELQRNSMGLLLKAENSQTELAALQTALRTAESSLTSLGLSFAAYSEAAEKKIKTLEKNSRIWKFGCIAAGAIAAGFAIAFFAGR
jgi:ABC-type multidrug transport system fused ATPase/permease subunit